VKKWYAFVGVALVLVLGLVAVVGVALAQGPEDGQTPPVGPVDEDGDGVCDICGQELGDGFQRGWRFNQDGEEQWGGRGPWADGEHPCDGFVDQDGDGVCDNYQDLDGDGVCDNRPSGMPFGRMGGRMGGRFGGRGAASGQGL
jgi:hypothetical protein